MQTLYWAWAFSGGVLLLDSYVQGAVEALTWAAKVLSEVDCPKAQGCSVRRTLLDTREAFLRGATNRFRDQAREVFK
jgi:hypothetical protein